MADVVAVVQRAQAIRNTTRRYVTEREVERAIEVEFGISRSTLKRWLARMKEVGMTPYSFTEEQVEYVGRGRKRGRKSGSS